MTMTTTQATRRRFPDGRWHWQHGPIDLIVEAQGDPRVVAVAHAAAWSRFERILVELVAELPLLRTRLRAHAGRPTGVVARRMWDACRPHRACFITPMAAVAGAVADELIAHYRVPGITRAWINNGGDIALHLAPGASVDVGVVADIARFRTNARTNVDANADANADANVDAGFAVTHDLPVRGIATSGWRGRSFSLGIADSVTVLARSAADADAAATMIANAVTVDDARIVRRSAASMKDDSDLGDLMVTVDVPALGIASVRRALVAGLAHAEALRADDVIASCMLVCQGMMMTTASPLAVVADRRAAEALVQDDSVTARAPSAWHATRLMPATMPSSSPTFA